MIYIEASLQATRLRCAKRQLSVVYLTNGAQWEKIKKRVRKTHFLTRCLPQTTLRVIIIWRMNDQYIANRSLKMLRAKQRRAFIKVFEF